MEIGQLFLNLGIKGSEKTVGALTNVKKGLSETASMSLEAKAGIIGAMYALERLFASSGKAGTDLTNFNALTGESVKTLQQYQYAARQVGVSNQEVEGSFRTLQSTMTKTLMGEGAPKGLARVSLLTGGITQQDVERFAKNPELLIQRLQQYASKEKNLGLRNETLKSFGLGDNMVAALSRNAFRPDVLKKAPTYSDREVGQLDKANIAWSNLGNKIEMAVGHFNAKHGLNLVSAFSKITDSVIHLAEAFQTLNERFGTFETIAHGLEGVGNTIKLIGEVADKFAGKESKKGDLLYVAPGSEAVPGFKNSPVGKFFKGLFSDHNSNLQQQVISHIPLPAMAGKTQNNVSIHNTFAHPGTDHKKTGDSMKKSVEQAFRQMSAQGQGT